MALEIRPEPTDGERAAIVAALEAPVPGTPQLASAEAPGCAESVPGMRDGEPPAWWQAGIREAVVRDVEGP